MSCIECLTFQITGRRRPESSAQPLAARLPWYIQPWSRDGRSERAIGIRRSMAGDSGRSWRMPRVSSGTSRALIRAPTAPGPSSDSTVGENRPRSPRARSRKSIISAPPMVTPVMTCSTLISASLRARALQTSCQAGLDASTDVSSMFTYS
jgi:hypothetical protein